LGKFWNLAIFDDGQNLKELDKCCCNWVKMERIGQLLKFGYFWRWAEFKGTGQVLLKLGENGRNWATFEIWLFLMMGRIWRNWTSVVEIGWKWQELGNFSKLGQNWLTLFQNNVFTLIVISAKMLECSICQMLQFAQKIVNLAQWLRKATICTNLVLLHEHYSLVKTFSKLNLLK
jgi:hypothetical protein